MTQTPSLAMSDFSLVTCLGAGRAANLAALRQGRSGLAPCRFEALPFQTYTGEIAGLDAHASRGCIRRLRLPQQPARGAGAAAGRFYGIRGGSA